MEVLVRTFKIVVSSMGNESLDAPTRLLEQHNDGVALGVGGSEYPGLDCELFASGVPAISHDTSTILKTVSRED